MCISYCHLEQGNLEALQPRAKLEHELKMVGKRLTDAEAVTSCRINVQRGRHLLVAQCFVIVDAVDRGHSTVVLSQDDEGARSMLGDMLLVAILIHQLALGFFAQQIVT